MTNRVLFPIYVNIQESFLKKNNIKEIKLTDIINSKTDAIIGFFKMGGYHNQTIETIIETKKWDIEHSGFCCWAYKGQKKINIVPFQKYADKELYIVMAYTNSEKHIGLDQDSVLNRRTGESLEEFHKRMITNIDIYIEQINDKTIMASNNFTDKPYLISYVDQINNTIEYPKSNFPEIVSIGKKRNNNIGTESVAYLFDEIYYTKEHFKDINISGNTIQGLSNLYDQILIDGKEGKFSNRGQITNYYIKLNEKYENKKVTLKSEDHITYLVAKLNKNRMCSLNHKILDLTK